jgi:tRNA nucleotidyltransferase/poly(A) polymerase
MSFTFTSDINIAVAIKHLFGVYRSGGYDCFLVGGAVRDITCGQSPKDFDFATNAPYEFTKSAFNKTIDTGIAHGTITVVINDNQFEVTRFRTDVNHDGRHCDISFAATISEDLSRRDFSINAMAMDGDGELFDPFGGRGDLCSGYIKFVGNPGDRIREDYLRILRWFRFMGRFGNINNIDQATQDSIRFNAEGLEKISGERIWSEMKHIIMYKHGNNLLELMEHLGVAKQIGMHPMFTAIDRKNSFEVTKGFTNEPELLIAAWLGWDKENLFRIADRWKWSTAERTHVFWLADHIGLECDLRRLIAIENVNRQWVRELAAFEMRDGWEQNAMAEWVFDPFPVNGDILMAMGVKPGMVMGTILRDLKEAWAISGYSATRDELLALVTVPN